MGVVNFLTERLEIWRAVGEVLITQQGNCLNGTDIYINEGNVAPCYPFSYVYASTFILISCLQTFRPLFNFTAFPSVKVHASSINMLDGRFTVVTSQVCSFCLQNLDCLQMLLDLIRIKIN